jgi:hypothetical protein
MLRDMKLDDNESAKNFYNSPKESKAGEKMGGMAEKLSQQQKSESQQLGEDALSELQSLQKAMEDQKNSFNSERSPLRF